jgi:hypothetical protein
MGKQTDRLKTKLMDKMRGEASWPEPLDISEAGVVLELTPQLSGEFTGCVSHWSIRTICSGNGSSQNGMLELTGVAHVDLGDGMVDEGEEIETFDEDDLESQSVEFIEFLADIVHTAWQKRCEEKGLAH